MSNNLTPKGIIIFNKYSSRTFVGNIIKNAEISKNLTLCYLRERVHSFQKNSNYKISKFGNSVKTIEVCVMFLAFTKKQ